MTIPYTYLIKFIPTGQVYYGSRTANNCHPDDLWVLYFTSSKTIKNLIQEYGKEAFSYEVRKTFKTTRECLEWEHKVLRRFKVTKNDRWLNRSYGSSNFSTQGRPLSEQHKKKIAKFQKGRKKSPATIEKLKNRTHTQEAKDKISKYWTGRKRAPITDENRKKLSIAGKGRKKTKEHVDKITNSLLARGKNKLYRITKETGEVIEFHHIAIWCKENNYSNAELYRMLKGTARRHKDISSCELIILDQVE